MEAIRPTSVAMPVAVTTMVPVPRVTDVFWNSMSLRSPRAMSAPASAAGSLPTGTLSPVSAASCASSVAEVRMRPSAGTMSPASTATMSPGTRSAAGTSTKRPSRITRAMGTCRLASASTLARALSSWLVPITTFSSTRATTTAAVEPCPITMLTTATATSIKVIGSISWPSATRSTDGFASCCRVLGPWSARRLAASAAVSPVPASTLSCSSASLESRRCHSTAAVDSVGAPARGRVEFDMGDPVWGVVVQWELEVSAMRAAWSRSVRSA